MLERNLEEIGFSPAFCAQAQKMGLNCLADILAESPESLQENTYFSYPWLAELTQLLEKENLLHLLQATPGRIRG
ncbi:hypothetical protein ACFGVR_15315 [Mucilaginibacter sp. AW1-3]